MQPGRCCLRAKAWHCRGMAHAQPDWSPCERKAAEASVKLCKATLSLSLYAFVATVTYVGVAEPGVHEPLGDAPSATYRVLHVLCEKGYYMTTMKSLHMPWPGQSASRHIRAGSASCLSPSRGTRRVVVCKHASSMSLPKFLKLFLVNAACHGANTCVKQQDRLLQRRADKLAHFLT